MKKYVYSFFMVLFLMAPAFGVEYSVDFGVSSAFMWRGIVLNKDAVLQSSATVAGKGFSANIWTNVELTNINNLRGNITEIDYTFSYEKQIDKFNVTGGFITYTFPHMGAGATTEVFAGASVNTVLNPSVTVFWDIDEVRGVYVQFGISHTIAIFSEKISDGLTISANVGYCSENFVKGFFMHENEEAHATFSDVGVRVDVPIKLRKGSLNFMAAYSNLVDSDLHTPGYEDDDSHFVTSVTYAIQF